MNSDLKIPTLLTPSYPRSKRLAAKRGFVGRCPNCNQAPLFRAYLKPVGQCSACGEPWELIRADDGPAWATMLLVGHVLAPLFPYLIFRANLSTSSTIAVLCSLAIVLSLFLLPRLKGLFIGFIWASGAPTS